MKARDLDRKFDRGEDIMEHLDLARARRPGLELRLIELALPAWMVQALERRAERCGVPREAIIKMWLADRLDRQLVSRP